MKKLMGLFVAVVVGCVVHGVEYTTGGAVIGDAITGAEKVTVNVAAKGFVTLNGDNSYSGGTEIVSGGVIVGHVNALGTTGDIVCRSGTAVRVTCSYGADFKTKILDRIKVVNDDGTDVTDASPEPWVSIQLFGDGVKNDVDFSAQPYLWLSGEQECASKDNILETYIPWNHEFHFGYGSYVRQSGYVKHTGLKGMLVRRLNDADDGTPRKVIVRGDCQLSMSSSYSAHTYSGGTIVEKGAQLFFSVNGDLGKVPDTVNPRHVIVRDDYSRLVLGTSQLNLHKNIGIYVDGGNVAFHMCGASADVVGVVNGPLGGSGTIKLTDQGGMQFASDANTFTGDLIDVHGLRNYKLDIVIGNGENFSWAGNLIKFTNLAANGTDTVNHRVVLHSNKDVDFNATLEGYGPIVKRGSGTVTLTQPLPQRTYKNGCAVSNKVVLAVEGGTLKLTGATSMEQCGIAEVKDAGVLDLNFIPFTTTWIFSGDGVVTNLYNGEANCVGVLEEDVTFDGSIYGSMKVNNLGAADYILAANYLKYPTSQFAGDVSIENGSAIIRGYNNTNSLLVADSANVEIGSTPPHVGLKLEIRKNYTVPKDANNQYTAYEDGTVDAAIDQKTDYLTDMSEFASNAWCTVVAAENSGGAQATRSRTSWAARKTILPRDSRASSMPRRTVCINSRSRWTTMPFCGLTAHAS